MSKMIRLLEVAVVSCVLVTVFGVKVQADTSTNEKTLFGNGMYAAGYGDVSAASVPSGSGGVGMGAAFGWQLLRAYGQAVTVGYGASALDGAKSMIHGPEFSLALLNDEPVSIVGTYSPSSGYYKRIGREEEGDRYILFSGTRVEGRVLLATSREIKVGLVAGTTSLLAESKFEEEQQNDFKGGTFFGLCLRASRM